MCQSLKTSNIFKIFTYICRFDSTHQWISVSIYSLKVISFDRPKHNTTKTIRYSIVNLKNAKLLRILLCIKYWHKTNNSQILLNHMTRYNLWIDNLNTNEHCSEAKIFTKHATPLFSRQRFFEVSVKCQSEFI